MILSTAFQSMKRSSGRTWLTLVGMVISAAFMTIVLTSNSQFGKVIAAPIRDLLGGDVLIMPGGLNLGFTLSGNMEFRRIDMSKPAFTDFDSLRAAVGSGAGIDRLSAGFVLLDARVNGYLMPVMARDFSTGCGLEFANRVVAGRPLGAEDEGKYSILAEESFEPKCEIGDVLAVELPRITVAGGEVQYDMVRTQTVNCTVVGLYRMRMRAPGQLYLMPMSTFRDITGLPEQFSLYATACMQDFSNEAGSIQSLADRIPSYHVFGPQDLYRSVLAGFSQGFSSGSSAFTLSFTGLMYIVSALIIGNTMLVAVSQRRREIAVMKAMGARTHQVVLVFIVEGVLLSLVGALVGFGLVSGTTFLATLGKTDVPLDFAAISLRNGLMIIGITSCAAILASILPAIGAARTDIMEVLRHE